MAYNGRKKGGIFARLTRLPERSEDYARKTLPSNRWALAWDLIRNNFGKLFKINLLMLLFIFPVVIIIIARASFTTVVYNLSIARYYAAQSPFSWR